MHTSLITADQLTDYTTKEAGPIIVALAFVIAVGGFTAAAIILCGWRGTKRIGVNWIHKKVEIVCR
jgi:hypothetical protein